MAELGVKLAQTDSHLAFHPEHLKSSLNLVLKPYLEEVGRSSLASQELTKELRAAAAIDAIALRPYVRTMLKSSINAFSDRSKVLKSLFHPSLQHRLPTQLECIQAGKRQCIPHHQRSIVLVRVPLRLSPTRGRTAC